MRAVWVCLLTVAFAFAEHPPRSACSKHTRGRLWPEEANADRAAAIQLMRAGEVYLCTYGLLHYHWEPLSVSLKTLEAAHAHPKSDAAPKPESNEETPAERAAKR